MKVYVDELPKSCASCKFCTSEYYCKLILKDIFDYDKPINRQGRCPKCRLKSLADYTKQVKKEVLADLKEKYKQKMANALGDDEEIGHINCDDVLEELLEEIGFDEVLELYRSQAKWYA